MITETGDGLSVLIVTETGQDWQTFATWYSIFKNLPLAKVAITSARNDQTPFQYFQWCKRLSVPVLRHAQFDPKDKISTQLDAINKALTQKIVTSPVLVLPPLVMAVDVFDQKLLTLLNQERQIIDNDVWFLKEPNMDALMNAYLIDGKFDVVKENSLCVEAKDTEEIHPVVSYRKGCGKWIDTLKGCPFSNANGLMTASMTSNENRVFDLWKRMCNLYSVVV